MSEARRTYDLLRSYVTKEWDRIRDVDWDKARQEIDDAINSMKGVKPIDANAPAAPTSVESSIPEPPKSEVDPEVRKRIARQLLGVKDDANFDDIRKAFVRLNKRSDPSRFAAGTPEATQAAEIQKKIHWAYQVLTEGMDEAEKRFRSLEI